MVSFFLGLGVWKNWVGGMAGVLIVSVGVTACSSLIFIGFCFSSGSFLASSGSVSGCLSRPLPLLSFSSSPFLSSRLRMPDLPWHGRLRLLLIATWCGSVFDIGWAFLCVW